MQGYITLIIQSYTRKLERKEEGAKEGAVAIQCYYSSSPASSSPSCCPPSPSPSCASTFS